MNVSTRYKAIADDGPWFACHQTGCMAWKLLKANNLLLPMSVSITVWIFNECGVDLGIDEGVVAKNFPEMLHTSRSGFVMTRLGRDAVHLGVTSIVECGA